MDLNVLKRFAIDSRRELLKTVSFNIEYVLNENSIARRESPKAIIELENKIKSCSKENVIEEVSYTWFNRFIALQYMDIKGFNDVKVLLPIAGNTRPEILTNAIGEVFDDNLISVNTQNIISSILGGRSASKDPEKEAYRLLIVSVCNKFNATMPFLFERIGNYTELLMPDDLLSKTSIITKIRGAMTTENCKDVEVIGWLYQFYIEEKKNLVTDYINKKNKVSPENIPAATQLFTPNWIVRYLVQNSLGRLWMLNNPTSNLKNIMEYYFPPEESDENLLKINSPEEIKISDPACGSGHMLTYAFDLLYFIYEEEGYDVSIIPSLILENNLYGIEIDSRAAELSAFALVMKAREKDKYFFKNAFQPKICKLENIKFETNELKEFLSKFEDNIHIKNLLIYLNIFENSDNFGSLIKPPIINTENIRQKILSKDFSKDIFLEFTKNKILKFLDFSDYLGKKYHVILTNPPYLGVNKMNLSLSKFAKKLYPNSKSDLYAMFMERAFQMTCKNGMMAMINMHTWMFLASYEKLRKEILLNFTLLNMAHIGSNGFDSIGGEVVSTTAFIFQNINNKNYNSDFLRLVDGNSEAEKSSLIKTIIADKKSSLFYRLSISCFEKIPGNPFIYWMSQNFIDNFTVGSTLSNIAEIKQGLATSNNDMYLRLWSEISFDKGNFKFNSNDSIINYKKKWYPYNKGGGYRNWYGNNRFVVNWENGGNDIKNCSGSVIRNERFYFKSGITYGLISSFSSRFVPEGFLFDVGGSMVFPKFNNKGILGFLCSKVAKECINYLNPTLNFQVGDVARLPIKNNILESCEEGANSCIEITKKDWDSYETSWDFTSLPLIEFHQDSETLEITFKKLRSHWKKITNNLLNLEIENNKVLIDAYGLKDQISPELALDEITLTCNPFYRYKELSTDQLKEKRLQSDTIKEFISYSVGCMFGRYSLDKGGLILADQGQRLENYFKVVPNTLFIPDDDNIIPILDLDWFEDDITSRFKKFLKITFGDDNFEDNLRFIEVSIGKNIRKYFLNDFYNDHVQTYKKRPIYWMFSSPKGSFNALIYMHRYQKDTVSILLEKYLREFLLKLRAERNTLEKLEVNNDSSTREKTKAIKEIQKIDNIITELQNWEKEIIFPLASQRIDLNLDDGVKINYPKFGKALKRISGLS